MSKRRDAREFLRDAQTPGDYVPGSTWGLPKTGPGSVAPVARRFFGCLIDWGLVTLAVELALHGSPLAQLGIFALGLILMTTLFGATVGQLLLGLRVIPVEGQLPMAFRALGRTLLLLLVLPALVFSRDKQPLHDVAMGTAVVRA